MYENKIYYTMAFGFEEKDPSDQTKLICSTDLYKPTLFNTTTIRGIKVWFGSPPEKKEIKSLLGLEVNYLNFLTGEKKGTKYQGAKIEGADVIIKELELKEGEYFTKFNLIFSDYITYVIFGTNKREIELGDKNSGNQLNSLQELNAGKYVILNLKGKCGKNGIRCLGCDYMLFKDFLLLRAQDLFKIRNKLKNDKEYKKKYENPEVVNKLNPEFKLYLKICKAPNIIFKSVISYL